MIENLELVCIVGDSAQVSARLPLNSGAVAEIQFNDFKERLAKVVGEVYSKNETSQSEE